MQKSLTQSELIIQRWTELEAESAGAEELNRINDALHERFGAGAAGPAAIARVLADEGVPLRHPEILDADARWREEQNVAVLPQAFETIDDAVILMRNIRKPAALSLQRELELIAKSATANDKTRALASEVANWLRIWLQNPSIFDDWLALRQSSPEFQQRFGS